MTAEVGATAVSTKDLEAAADLSSDDKLLSPCSLSDESKSPAALDPTPQLLRIPSATPASAITPPPNDIGQRDAVTSSAVNRFADEDAAEAPVPDNNLWVVMPAVCLVLFLAALDNTIISTSLPTIAAQFNATPAQYQWVGTSYLLASTLVMPATGRVSDVVGRKKVIMPGIAVFAVGSALCGASQSMNMLIGSRALQGLGGGLILSLVQIIVADITTIRQRGAWSSFIGATWGIAGSLGPILGGLITERASWRYCFFINLPTAALSMVLLWFKLKLNPPRAGVATWSAFLRTFDFVGLALLMSAAALLVVGAANAADVGWSSHTTIALLTVGLVLLVASVVHFMTTKRLAIIPARMFRTRTTAIFLVASTLHAGAFLSSAFYFPIFFQGVAGASPVMSGVYLLPFSIFIDFATILAGQLATRLRIVRPLVWAGYAIAALGYGLCIPFLAYGRSLAVQIIVISVLAFGDGLSLALPLLIIQAAMPFREMGSATTGWLLTRALGSTLGVAIFQAVLSSQLDKRFRTLEGYGTQFVVPTNYDEYQRLYHLPYGAIRDGALTAFSRSMRALYIIWTPMFVAALLLSLFAKKYSMNRQQGKKVQDEQLQPQQRHQVVSVDEELSREDERTL